MRDGLDLGYGHVFAAQEGGGAFDHRNRGVGRGGEALQHRDLAAAFVEQCEVGERPADVDAEPPGHGLGLRKPNRTAPGSHRPERSARKRSRPSARELRSCRPGPPRVDVDCNPDRAIERCAGFHQSIKCEPSETRIANAEKSEAAKPVVSLALRTASSASSGTVMIRAAMIEPACFKVCIRIAEVAKDLSAVLDQLELVLVHDSGSLSGRSNRVGTRSIPAFGVLTPVFSRKGCRFLGDIASMPVSAARAVCAWPARRCRSGRRSSWCAMCVASTAVSERRDAFSPHPVLIGPG